MDCHSRHVGEVGILRVEEEVLEVASPPTRTECLEMDHDEDKVNLTEAEEEQV